MIIKYLKVIFFRHTFQVKGGWNGPGKTGRYHVDHLFLKFGMGHKKKYSRGILESFSRPGVEQIFAMEYQDKEFRDIWSSLKS